jgi:hypothetical protein
VTGVGNYSFSHTETFSIQPRNINDVTAGSIVITSGSKATPTLVYNGQKLSAGKDYTINDANKKFTENGTINVTGKGNYTEKRDITVTVKSKEELKKIGTVEIKLTGGVKNYTYNGNEQKLASVIVYDSTDKNKMTPLAESTDGIEGDYLVSYSSNTKDAGKVTVTVVGTGEYTGTVTKTYTISPLALKTGITANIVDKENITYNSTGVTLGENLTVSYDGKDLIEGKDYKVSYSNNKKASSQAKYTVTFQGNYKGSAKLTDSFTINKAELSPQDVQVVAADKVYSKPNVYKSTPYVTVDGVTLKASEYTVKYYTDSAYTEEMDSKNNRINLGSSKTSQPVYVEIDFDKKNGNYTGKAYGTYNVTRKAANDIDISKSKITVLDGEGNKIAKLNYTGYGLTPTLKIEVKKGTTYETIDKSDYYKYFDIQYINNVNKGKATILINAISGSGYTGSKTATFSIVVNKK